MKIKLIREAKSIRRGITAPRGIRMIHKQPNKTLDRRRLPLCMNSQETGLLRMGILTKDGGRQQLAVQGGPES